jgi:hypothetical protein
VAVAREQLAVSADQRIVDKRHAKGGIRSNAACHGGHGLSKDTAVDTEHRVAQYHYGVGGTVLMKPASKYAGGLSRRTTGDTELTRSQNRSDLRCEQ